MLTLEVKYAYCCSRFHSKCRGHHDQKHKQGKLYSRLREVTGDAILRVAPPERVPRRRFRSSDRRKISHTIFCYPRDAPQKISAQSVKK